MHLCLLSKYYSHYLYISQYIDTFIPIYTHLYITVRAAERSNETRSRQRGDGVVPSVVRLRRLPGTVPGLTAAPRIFPQ